MILMLLCMICIIECVYMCSLHLCILLCNRAPWKNSVTEWFTLYKYIWKKKKKLPLKRLLKIKSFQNDIVLYKRQKFSIDLWEQWHDQKIIWLKPKSGQHRITQSSKNTWQSFKKWKQLLISVFHHNAGFIPIVVTKIIDVCVRITSFTIQSKNVLKWKWTWHFSLLIGFHYSVYCHIDHSQDTTKTKTWQQIWGLMQERRNSSANALELCLSYTNPLKLWRHRE